MRFVSAKRCGGWCEPFGAAYEVHLRVSLVKIVLIA